MQLTIALADDHKMMRQVLCSILSAPKYYISIIAETGGQLIEQIEKNGQSLDLCIVDVNMPDMDGFETTKLLKEKWPLLKVLMISAHHDVMHKSEALKVGADAFLEKDSTIKQLAQTIDRLFTDGKTIV